MLHIRCCAINGLIIGFNANNNKTKKNKGINNNEGRDYRNERGRERIVVITTKLGVPASSRMLRG